jgi:hypothetical protein
MDQLEHDIKTVRTIFVLLVALVAGISLYGKYHSHWHCDIGDEYIHCHEKQHGIHY